MAVVVAVIVVIQEWWLHRKKVLDHPLMPLLVAYFALWLPLAAVHRIMFLYHYMPAYAFAVIILVYLLDQLWAKYSWLVLAVSLAILACGVYFLPLSVGIPISMSQLSHHIWIQEWLY